MHKEKAKRVVGLVMRTGSSSPLTDAQLLQEFVRDRIAESFAEIVRRHGSMVFSVCRRVLWHQEDAEDAFQATFLVLARKAAAVRPFDSLGRWLYGVAFRTARRARSRRRRELERQTTLEAQISTGQAMPAEPADWLPLLDEELNRLSDRERLPIVLCDLMGRSRKEAAEELGLSEGTLSSRLARGRGRLRDRLMRRGVVPAISAAGLVLESSTAPAALVDSTFTLATTVTLSGVVNLADGVIEAMKTHSTAKLLVGLCGGMLIFGGAGLLWGLSPAQEAAEQKRDTPIIAVAPNQTEARNQDDTAGAETNATKDAKEAKEAKEAKDDAPKAKDDAPKDEKDDAKVDLEKLKGIWKIVYSEGEPPAVKLPKGGMLQKPMFLLIDKDHMTWDDGKLDNPDRLVQFSVDYNIEFQAIDISLAGTSVHGMYSFAGERLRFCWNMEKTPDSFSTNKFWRKQYYSVVLQRVANTDLQAAAKENATKSEDLQSLTGRWRITKVAGAQSPNVKVGYDFVIRGDTLKILRRDTDDITRSFGPLVLNTRTKPKQIFHLNDEDHVDQIGIYRFDKDRLEICWRIGDHDKKTEVLNKFEVADDAKSIQLIHLERVDAANEKTADGTRLVDLQKARVEALQNQILGLQARLSAGKDPIKSYLEASEKLADAQLELAADKRVRISIVESHLQRLVEYESFFKEELTRGKKSEYELAQIKANRLQAEIQLKKEKGE